MYELDNQAIWIDRTANEGSLMGTVVAEDATPAVDGPDRDPYRISSQTIAMLGAMTSAVMLCEGRDLAAQAGIGTVKYRITTPEYTRALKITDIAKGFPDHNHAHGVGKNADLSRRWILSMEGKTKPSYLARGTVYQEGDHGLYVPPEQPDDARDFGSIENLIRKYAKPGDGVVSYRHEYSYLYPTTEGVGFVQNF